MDLFSRPTKFDQKRHTKRLNCRFATLCEANQTTFNAMAVDVGAKGMRLVVPAKLDIGTGMTVSYARKDLEGKSVQVEVHWCRTKSFTSIIEVGCGYASPLEGTWVERALESMGQGLQSEERRQAVRAPIGDDYNVPVQINGTLPANVDNLGLGGMCVLVGSPLTSGDLVDLVIGPYDDLTALSLKARVIHSDALPLPDTWACGLGFDQLTTDQQDLLQSYIEQLLRPRADS